jgi:tRNA-modifying protein YgfZ
VAVAQRISPLRERELAAGARFGEALGWSLAEGFGDGGTPAEYAAARDDAGLVVLPERDLLAVSGPLRQKFLHNLLSNEVASLAPGAGRRAAFMDVKGHLLALLRLLVARDEVWLELPAERLEAVEERLAHYRVAAPVRFAHRPTVVLALLGSGAPARLRDAGIEPPADPESHAAARLADRAVEVVRAGDLPGVGFVLHVDPADAEPVWDALLGLDVRPVGRRALDALRIETGRAWYGWDVREENLLHETGLLAECHSPAKGCYVGQEVVARLEGRGGHVSKALRGLRLSTPALRGAEVRAQERVVGKVTSAAVSPRLGPIAMAYVQRGHFEPGTELEVGGRSALVTALPFE